jgi:hypothetical protein
MYVVSIAAIKLVQSHIIYMVEKRAFGKKARIFSTKG